MSDGAVNEVVEFYILETLPPGRERGLIRSGDIGRTVREGSGDGGLRRSVVWPNRAPGQKDA